MLSWMHTLKKSIGYMSINKRNSENTSASRFLKNYEYYSFEAPSKLIFMDRLHILLIIW